MTELVEPAAFGLDPATVIAVPRSGLTLYRLVMGRVSEDDVRPMSMRRAEAVDAAELLRTGLSHYLSRPVAERVRRRPGSSIVEVRLEPRPDVHIAKTFRDPDHVTVWARPSTLLEWTVREA